MYEIREARIEDLDPIVLLQRKSLDETIGILAFPLEKEKDYFRASVFIHCRLFVATMDEVIVGFIGYRKGWVDHLRVDSRHQNKGLGKALLERAKGENDHLQLWCFQHIAARAFYRSQGFTEVEFTDGARNDENLPDIRMEWRSP